MPLLRAALTITCTIALGALVACASDSPTAQHASRPAGDAVSAAGSLPSGERMFGQASVEPAYDADAGTILYLLTPIKAPFPSKAPDAARSPLYLVVYPAGSTVGTLNCMGVPGNCPDHDGEVAAVAMQANPAVYGNGVIGHDHIVDSPGRGKEFNVAWEVVEVVFTNAAAANQHLTTEAQINDAVTRGDAFKIDLGFAFNCSITSATTYWLGTPVGA